MNTDYGNWKDTVNEMSKLTLDIAQKADALIDELMKGTLTVKLSNSTAQASGNAYCQVYSNFLKAVTSHAPPDAQMALKDMEIRVDMLHKTILKITKGMSIKSGVISTSPYVR